MTHRLFIVYSACCLLLCACHNYQNKEEILIAIAEESVSQLAVEQFFLEHINSNWRPKIHHSLEYCENDSYYTVLAITTGWNRVLSLRFRIDPYNRGKEISYEGYTVSQFVDIKEAKKFSSYSEFKRRYGLLISMMTIVLHMYICKNGLDLILDILAQQVLSQE